MSSEQRPVPVILDLSRKREMRDTEVRDGCHTGAAYSKGWSNVRGKDGCQSLRLSRVSCRVQGWRKDHVCARFMSSTYSHLSAELTRVCLPARSVADLGNNAQRK
ncbi:hypothetical protein Bbelb_241270 [Branchiostoma belcheri]|nr:hypothetical protein Bbelb_241270 [Branchiostoma belcheri]